MSTALCPCPGWKSSLPCTPTKPRRWRCGTMDWSWSLYVARMSAVSIPQLYSPHTNCRRQASKLPLPEDSGFQPNLSTSFVSAEASYEERRSTRPSSIFVWRCSLRCVAYFSRSRAFGRVPRPIERHWQACRVANDEMAAVVASHPDRFIGVGLVPTTSEEVKHQAQRHNDDYSSLACEKS